jgi:mannose-6-phosphate isomerase
MNRLYPLKFKPVIKDKIWGGTRLHDMLGKKTKTNKAGESWEISGFPGDVSKVRNGFLSGNTLEEIIEVYMGDLVGDRIFDQFGTLFPLLIKFIDANDRLSVQVHPNDPLAEKQFSSYGKTEMWYIIESEKNAEIIAGFNQPVDAVKYKQHLNNKTLDEILNKETAVPGDVFFLPAGRIHAIGAGILLAEIQQTSDATLRIYDYDRVDDQGNPRELHTEMALEAIDFKPVESLKTTYTREKGKRNQVLSCDYFTTNYHDISTPVRMDYHLLDSFVIYICLNGSFQIKYYDSKNEKVIKGETVLIPAELKKLEIIPDQHTAFLEVFIGNTLHS